MSYFKLQKNNLVIKRIVMCLCSVLLFSLVGCGKKPFSTEIKELVNDDKANITTVDIVKVFENFNEYKEISKSSVDFLNDNKDVLINKEDGLTQEEYDQLKTFYTDYNVVLNAFTSYDINKISVEFYGEEPQTTESAPATASVNETPATEASTKADGKSTPDGAPTPADTPATDETKKEDIPYVMIFKFDAIPEELKTANYETINSVLGDPAYIEKYKISDAREMFMQKGNYFIEIHGRYCDYFDGIRNILDQRVK